MCKRGMKAEHLVGTSIPRFTFDTPTTPGNDFYKLCAGSQPLVMIFLPAFDHPVTREYLTRYLETLPRLRGVRLACVVRSSPRMVAKATKGAEFPFTVICDAPGVLYGYLGVEQARGLLSWSFAAQRIYKAAKEQGLQAILRRDRVAVLGRPATQVGGEADVVVADMSDEGLYLVRHPYVVLVADGHEVALGSHGCRLEVEVEAEVVLISPYLYIRKAGRILLADGDRVVGRSVVLDNDLQQGIGLGDDRVELLSDKACAIVGAEDDGNGWLIHLDFLSSSFASCFLFCYALSAIVEDSSAGAFFDFLRRRKPIHSRRISAPARRMTA